MLTSSSSFALIGHRTLELYYFILLLLFYYYYFILFYFIKYLALFTATIFPISTPTRTLHRHHLPYLHPNPHCSPKFGLYRFFNIFLQNSYLLTWRIWGKKFGLYRFFNIFSSKSLSFNMADLGRGEKALYTTIDSPEHVCILRRIPRVGL